MSKKIAINICYGGFSLSPTAQKMYMDRTKNSPKPGNFNIYASISRDDPDLIAVIESLGSQASGKFSKIRIITIPDDVSWEVNDYDGHEWIAEKHRIWYGDDDDDKDKAKEDEDEEED